MPRNILINTAAGIDDEWGCSPRVTINEDHQQDIHMSCK